MNGKRFVYAAAVVILLCLAGLAPPAWADDSDAGASGRPPSEAVSGPAGEPQHSGQAEVAPVASEYSGQAGVPLATPAACAPAFNDVDEQDYFYDAVRYLYCNGAVSGYGDGTFRPGDFVTRAQITKIVVLALDIPFYTPSKPTYEDVHADHPFYEYIESYTHYIGKCAGGCEAFRPYSYATRGQVAKIIALASCWPAYTPPTLTFSDVPSDSTFYQYIETAHNLGVISGYADGTFRPYNNITRGQVIKIVYRAVLQGPSCAAAPASPAPVGKP